MRWICREGSLHKGNANQAESSPDEEDLATEVGTLLVDHVGGGVGDGPVEKPVRGLVSR